MWCPVHFRAGCSCQYAKQPRSTETLVGKKKASAPKLLALSFAGLVLACGPRPTTCSERDAALLAREAECLARVNEECAGIPSDQPCAFEDSCNAFVRERCK